MSEPTPNTPDSPQFLPPGDPAATPPAPQGYPAAPGPQAYPAASAPQGYPAAPAPQGYPAAPGPQGYPAAPGPQGYPAAGVPQPGDPGASAYRPIDAAPPVVDENVGRGLLFSLLAIVGGGAAAVALYQAGYIASITSLLMAGGAVWLYIKGAGCPPRKGIVPLIAVIVVGVVLTLFATLAFTLYFEIMAEYPGAPAGEVWGVVMGAMFDPSVWSSFGGDAAMFVLFAALGAFGTLFQLGRAAKQQA